MLPSVKGYVEMKKKTSISLSQTTQHSVHPCQWLQMESGCSKLSSMEKLDKNKLAEQDAILELYRQALEV